MPFGAVPAERQDRPCGGGGRELADPRRVPVEVVAGALVDDDVLPRPARVRIAQVRSMRCASHARNAGSAVKASARP